MMIINSFRSFGGLCRFQSQAGKDFWFIGTIVFVWAYHHQNLFVPNIYNVIYSAFHVISVPTMTLFYITGFYLLSKI